MFVKCRPQDAHADVLRQAHDLGLLRVFLGVETSTDTGFRCLTRRQTMAQSEAALDRCGELGITTQFTVMVFHADAGLDSVRHDIDFMRRHTEHAFNSCRTEIYAGTPLEQRMLAEGRAQGTYLGRSYRMRDPETDLASRLWSRLFRERCGDASGLMNRAIGLDYRTAVLVRFHSHEAARQLRDEVSRWRAVATHDTLDLFEALIDLCAANPSLDDPGVMAAVRDLAERERASSVALQRRGAELSGAIDALARRSMGEATAGPRPPLSFSRA